MIFGSPNRNYMATIEHYPAGARKVITGRRDIPTALYMTKDGQQIQCEHLLEADAVMLLDFDPRIRIIRAQPHQLRFVWGGRRMIYYPDFLVRIDGKEFVIEVKSLKWLLRNEDAQEKLFRVQLVYRDLGINFHIITDRTIRVEPRLKNIKELLRYRNFQVSQVTQENIAEHLSKLGQDTFSNLMRVSGSNASSAEIRALIARGMLQIDQGVSIGENSVVTLRDECAPGTSQ